MIDNHKTNWNHMLFSTLCAYQIATKIATCFTLLQLIHGVEAILSIECGIPSLKLAIELLSDISTKED